ncbi:hypothetical protein AMTRI_Chr01g112110 [Amborella trichopoda]
MDILLPNQEEVVESGSRATQAQIKRSGLSYWLLFASNCAALVLGSISASMLSRFYFMHGGSSRWLSTWVQSIGFPLLLMPIYLSHLTGHSPRPFSLFTPKLLYACFGLGLLIGINNFLYSWGISYISVSTASLLLSTQLAFNAIFSFVLVKQKISFPSMNCIVLLTSSSILLALSSSQDMPKGVTKFQYILGFLSTLGAAGLFAVYLPLMEMVYKKLTSIKFTYALVMEMQLVMSISATLFATIGMVGDGAFREMREEANGKFELGRLSYILTVVGGVISWQFCFMATTGLIFLTTSLMCGICMSALLPLIMVAGAVIFKDDFSGEKWISTVLCMWGFFSYLYGERKKNQEVVGLKRENGERDRGRSMELHDIEGL